MANTNLIFKIVMALPATKTPHTVYMVYNSGSPTSAKFCMTDSSGNVVLNTVSQDDVTQAIAGIPAQIVTWGSVTEKPAVIAAGANAAAARAVIGAGTSSLVIGTTASTAKAGNYVPTWTEITSKPAVIAAGADAAEARFAIGAGTSNLALGTTDATAAKGDHTHAVATTSADGLMSAADKAKLDVAGGLKSVDASAAVFQATASDRIWVKYTAGPAVIKLPMTPVYGDVIEINKINGVTVTSLDLNGEKFQNTVTDGVILDFDNLCLGIAYSGSDFGWKVIYGI